MEPSNPRPSKIRKRANKACLACRARKVRCDVSQRGRPCMNCFLDSETCVVVGRVSKRRKPAEEEDANDNDCDVTPENASTEHLHAPDSGEPSIDTGAQRLDGPVGMDKDSDAGSHEREPLQHSISGVSALNTIGGTPNALPREHPAHFTSTNRAPRHEVPQPHHPSTKARHRQLQWAGEQSSLFGSDVMYSYYSFLAVNNLPNVLPQDVSYLELQGCFRVPTKTILDEFVKQYFLHVHPILPLINESDFWEVYECLPAEDSHVTRLSLLVFQAMLFAACAYVPRSRIRSLGYADIKSARAAFYRRAKLLFDFEVECSSVAVAQAAVLLSSWSPSDSRHVQTGRFWQSVAIQQAKEAGAHLYTSHGKSLDSDCQPSARPKQLNTFKRLWWCIICSDRVHSLTSWRPVQETMWKLDYANGFQFPFDDPRLADFGDEIEQSRVYNSDAKRALLQMFCKMMGLVELLTEVLGMALPLEDGLHWNQYYPDEEQDTIKKWKEKMELWYDAAEHSLSLPPRDPVRMGSDPGPPEPVTGHAHDSVVLYNNYLCLLYQSAMVRLCHYEYLRTVAQTTLTAPGVFLKSQKPDLTLNQEEILNAAFGTVCSLKNLTKERLSQWLPLNSIACVTMPLLMAIVDVKLSQQPSLKPNMLQELHESVKNYQPQLEITDAMSDTVHNILDLSSIDHLERILPGSSAQSADSNATVPHPSLYLRLAMASAPERARAHSGFMRANAPSDADLVRLLEPGMMNHIRLILSKNSNTVESTLSARSQIAHEKHSSSANDQAIQRRIAAWIDVDHAVSSELGMVSPPSLTPAGEARDTHSSLNVTPADVMEGSNAAWCETLSRAFSAMGDAREASFLKVFAFRDQTGRVADGGDASQLSWAAHEQATNRDVMDREAGATSPPEALQDASNVHVARLGSPAGFWSECFQQLKRGAMS